MPTSLAINGRFSPQEFITGKTKSKTYIWYCDTRTQAIKIVSGVKSAGSKADISTSTEVLEIPDGRCNKPVSTFKSMSDLPTLWQVTATRE